MAAAPRYPTRMAFRIMLRTGLRVSEALSLRRSDLRLNQDPPVISVRPEAPGNKSRKGREVPIPADLLESLADLVSFHSKERNRPMLDISRQWVGEAMKRAAVEAKIDPARSPPTPSATPTAATVFCAESRSWSCSNGWDISPWPTHSATWNWPAPTTPGWPSCKAPSPV